MRTEKQNAYLEFVGHDDPPRAWNDFLREVRMPECETCGGDGLIRPAIIGGVRDICNGCAGSGVKTTGGS